MKMNAKSTLILSVTLLIGILLGFLLKSYILQNKFDDMRRLRGPGGFTKLFEKIIEPTEEQKLLLDPVLEKYQSKMSEVRKSSFENMKLIFDSLRIELK